MCNGIMMEAWHGPVLRRSPADEGARPGDQLGRRVQSEPIGEPTSRGGANLIEKEGIRGGKGLCDHCNQKTRVTSRPVAMMH